MQLTLDVPDTYAANLGASQDAVGLAVLEILVVDGIRSRKLSVAQGRQMLGLSRYEMDGFLKRSGVLLEVTAEQVWKDAETSRKFREVAACGS